MMSDLDAPEPDGAPRLPALDVLRGIAILGILPMNIGDMGASMLASFGDVRHLGWSGADRWTWWARQVIADGTARAMLEMLFGAGMVILTGRIADGLGEARVWRRFLARNLVLLAFGLAHVFVLLWPGDILHTYALAALVAFPFRRLRPRLLILMGLSCAGAQLLDGGTAYLAARDWQRQVAAARAAPDATNRPLRRAASADDAARAAARARLAAAIAREDRARTGTVATWAGEQWRQFAAIEAQGLELAFVWEAAATMLIGAALFRLGILQGARPARFYARLAIAGYLIGLPLRAVGAGEIMRFDQAPQTIGATVEIARLATTLGHLGLVHLLLRLPTGARLLHPLRAAGRAALSIYIAQTVVCLWLLFPPFALALYGRLGWAALMGVALAVDAGLLLVAVWWMRRFAIAPVEWAWRSIVERRALAWRAPVFTGPKRV